MLSLRVILSVVAFAANLSTSQVPHRARMSHHLHPNVVTCSVTAGAWNFGLTYYAEGANFSTPATGTVNVTVTCTSGAPYTLTANTGSYGADAVGNCATAACTRAVFFNPHYAPYELYTTAAHTTVWNTVNGISGTGTGAAQTVPVYWYVPSVSVNPQMEQVYPGSYRDVGGVTVTVTY
jgi:spore coat protein U-like protein